MATHGDKIDELFKLAHTLTERVDSLREEVKAIGVDVVKQGDAAAKIDTKVALLEQQVMELKAWKDQLGITLLNTAVVLLQEQVAQLKQWKDQLGESVVKEDVRVLKEQVAELMQSRDRFGTRTWTIVTAVVSALLGGAISAIIAIYIKR